MPDLDERFRGVDRVPAPDQWDDIRFRPHLDETARGHRLERIRGGQSPVPLNESGFRRVGVVLVAFVIAAAGIALAIRAFRPTGQLTQPGALIQNGRIAFSTGPDADINVVGPDGGGLTKLVDRHARDQEGGLQGPAWSPDGTKLAFTDYRPNGSVGLYVMEAEGGTPVDVSPNLEHADSPSWSPDGTQLAFGGYSAARYDIYVIRADGTELRRVTDERDNGVDGAFMPAWSPDGAKIACVVTRYDARSETEIHGILIMSPDGSNPEFLTRSSEIDEEPVWSPDGTKIAFLRKTPDGYVDVFVTNAVGELTEATRISSSRVHVTSLPDWAPDSRDVVFTAQRIDNDNQGVYVASTAANDARVLLEDAYARHAVWSPDGRWIAFVRDDAGSGFVGVWLMRPDGTGLTELVGGLEEAGGLVWLPLDA